MSRATKLVAIGVLVVCVSSFVVIASLFLSMYVTGETSITIYANQFGEFWIELAMLAATTICFPVFLYELEDWIATA